MGRWVLHLQQQLAVVNDLFDVLSATFRSVAAEVLDAVGLDEGDVVSVDELDGLDLVVFVMRSPNLIIKR